MERERISQLSSREISKKEAITRVFGIMAIVGTFALERCAPPSSQLCTQGQAGGVTYEANLYCDTETQGCCEDNNA
jgi:hypothetical protein